MIDTIIRTRKHLIAQDLQSILTLLDKPKRNQIEHKDINLEETYKE